MEDRCCKQWTFTWTCLILLAPHETMSYCAGIATCKSFLVNLAQLSQSRCCCIHLDAWEGFTKYSWVMLNKHNVNLCSFRNICFLQLLKLHKMTPSDEQTSCIAQNNCRKHGVNPQHPLLPCPSPSQPKLTPFSEISCGNCVCDSFCECSWELTYKEIRHIWNAESWYKASVWHGSQMTFQCYQPHLRSCLWTQLSHV